MIRHRERKETVAAAVEHVHPMAQEEHLAEEGRVREGDQGGAVGWVLSRNRNLTKRSLIPRA